MTEGKYGSCPFCSEPVNVREFRYGGNDTCASGHIYPSPGYRCYGESVAFWRAIDIAPRDGSDVIVAFKVAGTLFVRAAFYRSIGEWEASGQYCDDWDSPEEYVGWWSYDNTVAQVKLEGIHEPTHWMPMPPEPE